MVTQDYQAGYKKGAEDCAGSLARLDEMERQRDAAWLECRRLRDALMGLRALVKAEFPSMECVDIDKADSALSGRCAICGNDLSKDLFASVTGEKCCCICKTKYIGGLPTSNERIAAVRGKLGLEDGQFIQQDNGAEAARILGR